MAQLIDIERVEIGPENLTAQVHIAEGGPLMTSDDIEGTARVYQVLPHIVEHVCLGDAGETFRDAMPDTEIAHLLEHVTVELLAQTDLAGDMPAGRTWIADDAADETRTYLIELACPDDVLVAAALSSGAWILDWAYGGGGAPEPDVEAIVNGLVDLVQSVEGEGEDLVVDYGDEAFDELPEEAYEDDELEDELAPEATDEPAAEPEAAAELDATTVAPPVEERPLWTPAPEVRRGRVVRAEPEASAPEVEAEIDQIMATISMPALTDEENAQDF